MRIAYATTDHGPAIVNVLGWATHIEGGFNSPLYDAAGLLPMSSAHHLFVRYDGRGFGLSDRDVKDFSVDARVRDLEAVVDALRLDKFGLYAMSAGGPTAIAYIARHPERVDRLVLASTTARIRGTHSEGFGRILRALPLFETDWQVPAVTGIMVDWVAPTASEVQRRVLGEFFRRSGSGAAIAGFFSVLAEIDVSDQARQIIVPTLVVHGRDDQSDARRPS